MVVARSCDLVFVNEALPVDADALDNLQLVAFVMSQYFRYECVPIPMAETGRGHTLCWIVATAAAKTRNRARSLMLHNLGPSLLHPLAHFFNLWWWNRRPDLQRGQHPVCRFNRAYRKHIRLYIKQLKDSKNELLGVVLNGLSPRRIEYYSNYRYYRSYKKYYGSQS